MVMQSNAVLMNNPIDIHAKMMNVNNRLDMEAYIILDNSMDIDPSALNISVRAVYIGPHAMWLRCPHHRV